MRCRPAAVPADPRSLARKRVQTDGPLWPVQGRGVAGAAPREPGATPSARRPAAVGSCRPALACGAVAAGGPAPVGGGLPGHPGQDLALAPQPRYGRGGPPRHAAVPDSRPRPGLHHRVRQGVQVRRTADYRHLAEDAADELFRGAVRGDASPRVPRPRADHQRAASSQRPGRVRPALQRPPSAPEPAAGTPAAPAWQRSISPPGSSADRSSAA
jgi:hypothetical protein